MTMVTVTQYGQYNQMYSVSKCWEKLGKDLQEHAHGNKKKTAAQSCMQLQKR